MTYGNAIDHWKNILNEMDYDVKKSSIENAIGVLKECGFVEDGETQVGRTRFRLPETKIKATVGKVTTCIYDLTDVTDRKFTKYRSRTFSMDNVFDFIMKLDI